MTDGTEAFDVQCKDCGRSPGRHEGPAPVGFYNPNDAQLTDAEMVNERWTPIGTEWQCPRCARLTSSSSLDRLAVAYRVAPDLSAITDKITSRTVITSSENEQAALVSLAAFIVDHDHDLITDIADGTAIPTEEMIEIVTNQLAQHPYSITANGLVELVIQNIRLTLHTDR